MCITGLMAWFLGSVEVRLVALMSHEVNASAWELLMRHGLWLWLFFLALSALSYLLSKVIGRLPLLCLKWTIWMALHLVFQLSPREGGMILGLVFGVLLLGWTVRFGWGKGDRLS